MHALRELARAAGLDPEYTSWRGEPAWSSDDTITLAIRALVPDLPDDHGAAIAELTRRRWREVVPPVVVAWDGELVVELTVPAERDGDWELEIATEGDASYQARGRLFDLPADRHAWPDGVVHCVRRVRVPIDGELGYHTMTWQVGGAHGETMVISAPMMAHGGPGTGPRRWGVFAPVYGLADAGSGQAGDLATLRRLFAAVEQRGGRYVATLPILAAFLDEPCVISPYSPASRLYWNELYLDFESLSAEVGLPAPGAPGFDGESFRPGLIDYRAQYRWRRATIDAFAGTLLADRARAASVAAWAGEVGAFDYAAFRAIGEVERTGWRSWPAALRDGVPMIHSRAEAVALGAPGPRVDSHVVAQWAMQRQLERLYGEEVGLYLDLPVGVSRDAYEVWRWRELFVLGLAAGAPPDALFLGGQDWGLPPLSPTAIRTGRYRYVIACLRHHMRVARMLRVDHVMGLFRLYCVPDGRPATDGVYVRYHADELLAILTLESLRARCAIAGEDLGTVPAHVRPAMAAHGFYRLHVGQWSFPTRSGDAPEPSPAPAIASLNTHDTPTFVGWWRGADIDDQRDLGMIDADQERVARAERERTRDALHAFAAARVPGDGYSDVERAMIAATAELAAGPAEIVLIAVDDLTLEPVPHNVPGTTRERPNWMRRVADWADVLDDTRGSLAATAAVTLVASQRSSDRDR